MFKIGITIVFLCATLRINGISGSREYPFTQTKMTSGRSRYSSMGHAFTGFTVNSSPVRITRSPCRRIAARCSPRAIKETSFPALARYAPSVPPVPPAPIIRYFRISHLHSDGRRCHSLSVISRLSLSVYLTASFLFHPEYRFDAAVLSGLLNHFVYFLKRIK